MIKEISKVGSLFHLFSTLTIFVLLLVLPVLSASGQSKTQPSKVTGSVTDNTTGEPVIGASITVKGTTLGTVSDANGKFSIDVPDVNGTIVVTFVGYTSENIELAGQVSIEVKLKPEITNLNEVVVIGYTTAQKKNLAASFSQLNSNEIVGLSTTDMNQALQGKVAGVQVINNSGDPNSGAQIIVRGMGSFTDVNPLYVIDGIAGGDINAIPTSDIQSISILKDASSTAIYGTAGANGVVIITTKSGQAGKLKVSYDGSIGNSVINKRLNMLNASQYIAFASDYQTNTNSTLTPFLQSPYCQVDRTNWQSAVMRQGTVTQHSLSFSGGTDNMTFLFTGGYTNQQSTIISLDFQRFTMEGKMSEKLFNNRLRLNEDIRVKSEYNNGSTTGLLNALEMPPYLPVYDPTNIGGYATTIKTRDLSDADNPVAAVNLYPQSSRTLGVETELSGELEIVKGLTLKSQARITAGNYHWSEFEYPNVGGNFTLSTPTMNEQYTYNYSFILENFLNYEKSFGIHAISLTAGNSYQPAGLISNLTLSGSGFPSTAITTNISLANSNSITGEQVNSQKSRLSYYGRLGYTLLDKYVINATLREDASSVFGTNNQWGTFYGLGLAWNITKESFMSAIPEITNLKLRASYGVTGNDNIPPFLTYATVWTGSSNNIVYSFGENGTYQNGATINSLPNPNLKWEQTDQWDAGLDVGLIKNRLNFVFDYYNRDNLNLLINTLLPLSTGIGNPTNSVSPGSQGTQWINAASMRNTGFETSISYTSKENQFTWNAAFNLTYSVNNVTGLGTVNNTPIEVADVEGGMGTPTITTIGHPIASFYGYVFDHIAIDQNDINNLNAQASKATGGAVTVYQVGLQPGDRVWKDVTHQGYINTNSRTEIGNPSPKFHYGLTLGANFKNFDFTAQFQGVAKVDVLYDRFWTEGMPRIFNQTTNVLNRWEKPGDVKPYPAAGQDPALNNLMSTFYVCNGAYLRCKNISIGYTIPKSLIKNPNTSVRIYASVQNLFTITNYPGYDPEVSSSAPTNASNYIFYHGVDQFQHPNPTIYKGGLQLNF